MTALLVDVGNTRVKWATVSGGLLRKGHAGEHRGRWSATGVAGLFDGAPQPSQILVACVAGPDAESAIARLAIARWGCRPAFLRATSRAGGVTNGYERPELLGIDRWLALIAAHADHAGPACIADCGSAVTVDVVDASGRHRGGIILPGIRAMGECVLARTRVPRCELIATDSRFGRSTPEALGAGAFQAVLGAVGRSFLAAREILGETPRLLLAGGDAARVAAALDLPTQQRPDLVIEGLAILAKDTEE